MRGFVLCCTLLLFCVFGYQVMKKVDAFLNTLQTIPQVTTENDLLNIVVEHVDDIACMEEVIEKMAQNGFKGRVYFYYGSGEEIKKWENKEMTVL